jgi:RecB family endonuclease NucS
MSNIGLEVLKIALHDAVEKQQFITAELEKLPEHSNVRKLVAEQSQLIEETLTLLNRIA